MKARYLNNLPEIHSTPLQKIYFDEDSAYIEFDDADEIRWIVRFKTIQAWKSTDINFFDMVKIFNDVTSCSGMMKRYPIVFDDSSWIEDLETIQNRKDISAQYLEKSKHILFILGDDIVEVITGDNYEFVKKQII